MTRDFCILLRYRWFNKPSTAGWKLRRSRGSVFKWWPLCRSNSVIHQRRGGASKENAAKIPQQAKEQHFNGKECYKCCVSVYAFMWEKQFKLKNVVLCFLFVPSCSLYPQWWHTTGEILWRAVSWITGRRLLRLCWHTPTLRILPVCAVSWP